ncbi:hypothetical protein ACQEU5_25080 [Marinactinospora thermotolerans]|uniref:hypothetical protein n=1 Tax=Marinactinospora thermotolerans TaxID=531310 RepID=UPI003D916F10
MSAVTAMSRHIREFQVGCGMYGLAERRGPDGRHLITWHGRSVEVTLRHYPGEWGFEWVVVGFNGRAVEKIIGPAADVMRAIREVRWLLNLDPDSVI